MTDRPHRFFPSHNGSSRNTAQGITEEEVRVTTVLANRPTRQPNLVAEVQSLPILAQQLMDNPQLMLKTLAGFALDHCQAGTAGVSLLETASNGESVLRWVAITGAFADLEQITIPSDFSPCGTTLRTNQPQLYAYPERCYTYLHHPQFQIVEKLIIPLCVNRQPLGTLWILSHHEARQFDLEDQRLMTSLAGFAAAALQSIAPLGQQVEDTLQQEQEAHTELEERSQVALHQSEALNQQIFNSSDDCLKVLDLSGRLLYMNPRGQALVGIENLALFLNRYWIEFWQGNDRESALHALDTAKAGGVGSFQGYCPTLAGEPKWWDVKLTPIRGVNGQVERLLCISRDITERKQIEEQRQQTEAALRESEENFRAMFNASSSGKAQADAKTRRLLRVNPALCQITGYSESELLSMTLDDLNHPEDRERDRNLYQNLASRITDKSQSETRYIRKDGSIVWVNVISNVIHDVNGNPLRTVAIIQDISDRKRIEDERKRREANLAFLAEIADDFSRLSTADEIMQTVGAKIGAYLKITTCNFTDVDEARGEVTVHYGWNSIDVPSTVGTFRLREYLSEEFERASRAGATIVICNTQIDPRTHAPGYAALNMHSFVTVPFHCRGRWRHYIAICDSRPRDWRADEIELIEEISNRVFPRIERARAEAALRESEAKYRLLFESIDEGFCICEMLFAENGDPIDYRFLEVNPVFERLTGLENVMGKTARELVPNLETHWFELYGSVVETGKPARFEQQSIAMNRWFDVNAFCIGEPHSRKFAILFTNITERKKAEQERERFLAVGSDFLVITGIDRYFHWVSPSFERLLGWTVDEMTSRPWTEFVHPDDINSSVAEINSLFSGNETRAFENRYRHKDGSYRWLIWNAQPYLDEQVIYGTAVDITDRKLMEVALRDSEEQFRNMADHAPFMVWVTDPTGYCTYLSQSWYDFTGQTSESGLGLGWLNRTHPDDRQEAERIFLDANQRQEAFRLEYRLQSKDGEYIWAIDAASPWFGTAGQFKGYVGSVIDISDRKQAEAALAADLRDTQLLRDLSVQFTTEADSQVLYNEIVATAITLMQSDAGSFQVLDPATQELLLLATQGFGPSLAGHFDRVDTSFNTSCAIALATGERAFVDFDVSESADPKGYRRMHVESGLLSAQSTPLISRSGKLIGMVSTHWGTHHRPSERELRFFDLLARQAADLLEQRQAEAQRQHLLAQEQAAREEAERANRVKDEFLAVLSHELRTPLNPILGWSTLLLNKKLDEAKTAHALGTIQRNARLQSELIEDLLDVARILSGKLSLNVTPVNLAATILGAIETVRLAAEAKSIKVEASLAPDIGLVAGDSTRLQQVIWNLLSNGVKFTPAGGQISIRLERLDSFAHIMVKDTGQGIAPNFLPYIFDHFRQADGSTTRQFGGLGLGLAIVRYLVELHGGTVRAESPGEGQGATFIVRLPVMPTPPETNQDEQPPEQALDLKGVKTLLVDDETDTRELVAFILEQQGAQVVAVSSVSEALVVLSQAKPDVLLSDIGMPSMDGYMLIQQVRTLAPEQGGQVPAIALTAYAGDTNQQQVIAAGFQKHISKPIDPEVLVQAIAHLVRPT
jgi:PAS domain S-box-containing protein